MIVRYASPGDRVDPPGFRGVSSSRRCLMGIHRQTSRTLIALLTAGSLFLSPIAPLLQAQTKPAPASAKPASTDSDAGSSG